MYRRRDVSGPGNVMAFETHRVLRRTAGEPIEICVVGDIEEELAASAVGLSCVGHRESARGVGVLADVLVLNVATAGARLGRARHEVGERAVGRPTSPSAA